MQTVKTIKNRNVVILVILFIILAASIIYGVWRYSARYVSPLEFITPEDIETLTITTDTTLTEDHFNTTIVIGADGVTLDGDGHMIIGPGPDFFMRDPDTGHYFPTTAILLEGRTGVIVKNCYVTGFQDGFILIDSDGNLLQGNTAYDIAFNGFILEASSNNTLLNNTAKGSGGDDPPNGFYLGRSDGNILQGNTANGNYNGFILDLSDENILQGNTVKDNVRGFGVGECCNNTFFHNTLFINASERSYALPKYANTWDNGYPSGGNYWSDYTGVDANDDGIGDTPYVINEDNVDRFPLMTPMSVFDAGVEVGENDKE